jgi:hypothetical protein
MFSTGRFRRALAVALVLCCARQAAAQTAAETSLYRVFLLDGTTIFSFGEFARVADRVVLSVPVGAAQHMVSIPAETVDWERTDAYAESVRATRYATTRGPEDLAQLSNAVAIALNDIALTTDGNRKIAMAIEARQNVMKWAADHFGYGAERIARMASFFDDVIAETRQQFGAKNFDLSLVANMAAPPSAPLLPPPNLQDSIAQALAAAALTPEPTERISLLRAIEASLDEADPGEAWAASLRARASAAIATEERTSRGYTRLTRTALQGAERSARAADVTGVERAIRRALAEDDRLGQQRPKEMASLLAVLDGRLDAARRLRLARDSWTMRAAAIRKFRAAVAAPLSMMRTSKLSLDQIGHLAGPAPARLTRLVSRTAAANQLLAVMAVPAEAETAFGLLRNAVRFATRAAEGRQRAVMSGQMTLAWEAASAASGALMFLDRAVEELELLSKPPVLQAPR